MKRPKGWRTTSAQVEKAGQVADKIAPMLANLGPEVQGAVLVELTATWLSGFQGPTAAEYREELFALHIQTIRDLVDAATANKKRRDL